MIYVVALNIQRFAHLCHAVNLRGDGRHPVTGEQGMQYMHRAETCYRLNPHTDKIYLSEGWSERADYSNFIVCVKAFRILGGKVEGANLELVSTPKRYDHHPEPGSGRHHGLRVVAGEPDRQPGRRRGVVR